MKAMFPELGEEDEGDEYGNSTIQRMLECGKIVIKLERR